MACARCRRRVSTIDRHCGPCRRHLGLDPFRARKPEPQPQRKRKASPRKGKIGDTPKRQAKKKLERAAIGTLNQGVERSKPSLPRIPCLERELPKWMLE